MKERYDELLNLANEMFQQLELMDYENKAKETYDEFKEELKNLSTSHNTDYNFGSKKEPQPKGKDFPERCEEHGLYLYLNGRVRTCKLGCVYHENPSHNH